MYKLPYLIENLKSNYCKLVFVIAWVTAFKIVPEGLLKTPHLGLTIFFSTTFAFSIACMVRSIKEKAVTAQKVGGSVVGIITSTLGISALQVCGLSNPMCGASVGLGFLSTLFPSVMFHYGMEISLFAIILGIFFQLFSLYKMHCLSWNTH